MRSKNGFTLYELVLVIAVAAVIGAILWPVWRSSQDRKSDECASNLKQIGVALTTYIEDYDQHPPAGFYFRSHGVVGTGTSTLPTINTLLAPLLKDTRVWRCPMDTEGGLSGANSERSYVYTGRINTAAGQPDRNTGLVDANPPSIYANFVEELSDPANTVTFVEAWGPSIGPHAWNSPPGSVLINCDTWKLAGRSSGDSTGAPPACGQFSDPSLLPTPGHSNRGNTLFMDGRVKALTWPEISHGDFWLFKRRKS